MENQLEESDHQPIYPTIAVKTVSTPVLPRWNYKKTNWLLYHHHKSVLTKNIHIYDRDINKVVSEFTRCILQAAKEAIPKGARKEYRPYWNNDLDKLHNELHTARDVAESEPTSENNTALKQVNAVY